MEDKIELDDDYYPLSHPQKRIWYMEKIYSGTSQYNIGGYVRIKGNVNLNILEQSINIFIKKNEGMRLRFQELNHEAVQYVSEYKWVKMKIKDFRENDDPENELYKWIDNEARKPFELINSNLFHFSLCRLSDHDNGYFVRVHHIISDGWSMNIMTSQICDVYMKLLSGEFVNDAIEYTYLDYIAQEQKYLASSRFQKNKTYWMDRYKHLPVGQHIIDKREVGEGRRKTFVIEELQSVKIKDFIVRQGCSLNTLFIALFLIYQNKLTNEEKLVIGTPILNRSGKREKNMIGMFTNTMPFLLKVEPSETVEQLIHTVNDDFMKSCLNQKYPYDLLIRDLDLSKKRHYSLFDTCINYYNTKLPIELDGAPVENYEFYNGYQAYPLQLIIKEWSHSEKITISFDFRLDIHTDEEIEMLYSRLKFLLDQMLFTEQKRIADLNIIPPDEKNQLVHGFNDTLCKYPDDKTICQLFEEQAAKSPFKAAIFHGDKSITYKELDERSNQLARYLVKKGVGLNHIIGLMTEHSCESIIGILGIIKAGGAYLPIDPEYPAARIKYMLEDSNASILLVNCEIKDEIGFKGQVIDLNSPELYSGDVSSLNHRIPNDSLVYLIYTSGSTGLPKGVMVPHRGLVNYIWWAKKAYTVGEEDVFPLYSSISFDLTVTSIFSPLLSGGSIAVYRDDKEEYVLYQIIEDNQTSVIKMTPSHLALLKEKDISNSSLKKIIVGGENFKIEVAKEISEKFGRKIDIFNEYGPTETVVGCMIHKYDYNRDNGISVPIGMPADNVLIYILDENLNAVPVGCTGDIYISGDGLALGYLNQSALTDRSFIDNPFVECKKMYKTGDLAKRLYSGEIEYLGRSDNQIKLRGYRIELGEIEKCMLSFHLIKDAVVAINEVNNSQCLCAYFVEKEKVSIDILKVYLSNNLPEYMVPIYYVALKEIPLTHNGKVNYSMLPEPTDTRLQTEDLTRANSLIELRLIEVLEKVLNISGIKVKDNFYHLGGDSIKAIQISSRLKDHNLQIKVKDILLHPIIEEMALYINDNTTIASSQASCEGTISPTPIIRWFLSQDLANVRHYNQSLLLRVEEDFSVALLEQVLDELVKHHDSLRINYNLNHKELFYNNSLLQSKDRIETIDLSLYPYEEQCEYLIQKGNDIKASFNLEHDLLIRSCIFDLGQYGKRLLITAHHLVIDGVSWRIILEDMQNLYYQLLNNSAPRLPSKTHSYQDWAISLNDYNMLIQSGVEPTRLKEEYDEFVFPVDFKREDVTDFLCYTVNISLSEEETMNLISKALRAYGNTVNDLLIVALASTIQSFIHKEHVVIELESHGREEIHSDLDVSRTVGWFTSIYPVYLEIKEEADTGSKIKSIKEQLRNNSRNGFDEFCYKYGSSEIVPEENKQIRFNYLGDLDTAFDNSLFSLADEATGADQAVENKLSCLIDINAIMIKKRLQVAFSNSSQYFHPDSIMTFADVYIHTLKNLISHCCNKELVEYTPSDFDTVDISQVELDLLFE